jgi:hypothetical protein
MTVGGVGFILNVAFMERLCKPAEGKTFDGYFAIPVIPS